MSGMENIPYDEKLYLKVKERLITFYLDKKIILSNQLSLYIQYFFIN